ncbi:MAG: protein kinase [Polyangiaceae bacterium]|nr:protein kinase [Polyangiaceae bacterium]
MMPPVNVGQVLAGKYRIERVLGMGGMGVVVAARHLHLEERVAIKFLQPDALQDPTLVTRFLREAKAAAKIRSEHVARVFDVGTLENGAPYLVMEYLEGSDLAAAVKLRGPLPVAVAVDYLLQACEAIAEAHAAGIIHRDLKPSNLFVTTRADGSHVVKVIDFGISKVTTGADAGMDITKTAEMRGSLLFMPPEQMSRPRDVDPRSDIWALGVSLYNLLTGTYPFRAETVPHLCAIILNEEPTPPRVYRPEVPAALEAVILQCLRKNPAQRFGNVAKLAAVLVDYGTPAARISAERIAGTIKAAAERKTQPSAPSIEMGSQSAIPPPLLSPNSSFMVAAPSAAPAASVPTSARAIEQVTAPLPISPSTPTADPSQTAQSMSGAISPARDRDAFSKKQIALLGMLGVLAVLALLMMMVVVWPRSTTGTDDAPPVSAAVPTAAQPEVASAPDGGESPPAPTVSPIAPAIPPSASASPTPAPTSSGDVPATPTSPKNGGDTAVSDATRGSTATPMPSRVTGAAPAGAASVKKKSIDDMFAKPD